MNINATLFGQLITFTIFVWVNMKFIWPKIMLTLNERENKIITGLQAAEKGQKQLAYAILLAKEKEAETIKYCSQLIDDTKKQSEQILANATAQAKQKSEEIIKNAYIELQQEQAKLQEDLKKHMVKLIIQGAEKIITSQINQQQHNKILDEISNKLYENKSQLSN